MTILSRTRPRCTGYRLAVFLCAVLCALVLAAGAVPVMAAPVATLLVERDDPGQQAFAQDLAHLWQRRNVPSSHRLAVRDVAGARERLARLQRGRADFVTVPASVAYRTVTTERGLGVVAALWPESVHALTRERALTEMSVNPGIPVVVLSSAAYAVSVLRDLQGAGTALRDSDRPLGLELGAAADQVVLVSGFAPMPEVELALRAWSDLRLLSFGPRLLDEVRLRLPWAHTVALPADTYPGQDTRMELPGQYQLLVARMSLAAEPVRKMLTVLYRGEPWGSTPASAARFAALERRINAAFAELMPLHPEAARAYGLQPSGE